MFSARSFPLTIAVHDSALYSFLVCSVLFRPSFIKLKNENNEAGCKDSFDIGPSLQDSCHIRNSRVLIVLRYDF